MGHCFSSCLKTQVPYKNNSINKKSSKLPTPPSIDMYNVIIEFDKDTNKVKQKPIADTKNSSPLTTQGMNESGDNIGNNLHHSSKHSKTSLSTGSGNLSAGSCIKFDSYSIDSPCRKVLLLYDKYKDKDNPNCILATGIEKFCEDLCLNPDDFEVLALAWKFNAETMSCFTIEEFIRGCQELQVTTLQDIQAKFPEIIQSTKDKFTDFYKWAFQFGLEPPQRFLPLEMAMALWKLIFKKTDTPSPLLSRWLEFLSSLNPTTSIKRDTWDMLLRFFDTFKSQDELLNQYTDMEAWPSLFDDFVEFEKENRDKNNNNIDKLKDNMGSDQYG